jgi:putative transposase
VPVLIAMSDNDPQMGAHSTKEFMAACAIMQRFGRPGTPRTKPASSRYSGTSRPTGRTWTKSATPASSLSSSTCRTEYNTVRPHAGIGYLTPERRTPRPRQGHPQARRDRLAAARQARIAYRRTLARNPS